VSVSWTLLLEHESTLDSFWETQKYIYFPFSLGTHE